MVADLREMQENQWVSEIQIDKSVFVEMTNCEKREKSRSECDPSDCRI